MAWYWMHLAPSPSSTVFVTEVGCSWGGTRLCDARPSYFNLLNLELCEECSRALQRLSMGWSLLEQPAWSSSRSGRNRGAAVESDAIGEQQLKRTQRGAAVEADAIGEQQLKRRVIGDQQLCTERCPAPNYHVGERGGSS